LQVIRLRLPDAAPHHAAYLVPAGIYEDTPFRAGWHTATLDKYRRLCDAQRM
jgi:hypothetical protein